VHPELVANYVVVHSEKIRTREQDYRGTLDRGGFQFTSAVLGLGTPVAVLLSEVELQRIGS